MNTPQFDRNTCNSNVKDNAPVTAAQDNRKSHSMDTLGQRKNFQPCDLYENFDLRRRTPDLTAHSLPARETWHSSRKVSN